MQYSAKILVHLNLCGLEFLRDPSVTTSFISQCFEELSRDLSRVYVCVCVCVCKRAGGGGVCVSGWWWGCWRGGGGVSASESYVRFRKSVGAFYCIYCADVVKKNQSSS